MAPGGRYSRPESSPTTCVHWAGAAGLGSALVLAVALDWLIWRAVPDAYTLTGGAIIIASGLYLIRRETPRVVVVPP